MCVCVLQIGYLQLCRGTHQHYPHCRVQTAPGKPDRTSDSGADARSSSHSRPYRPAFLPSLPFLRAQGFEVKTIVKQAIAKDYTDIIIVNEDRKQPNALIHIHLPDGPTAHYKLTRCEDQSQRMACVKRRQGSPCARASISCKSRPPSRLASSRRRRLRTRAVLPCIIPRLLSTTSTHGWDIR